MCTRNDLLISVANTIKTYREGEIPEPTPEHVDRWLNQFTPAYQLPFLQEINHVLTERFFTKENIKQFLNELVKNERLAGQDPNSYWKTVNFLDIQKKGHSQTEMLELFDESLTSQYGLSRSNCGLDGGDFIYIDDVIFSGGRVITDVVDWIINKAPQNARLHIVVAAMHTGGHWFCTEKIKAAIKQCGKNIESLFWRALDVENRKYHKNTSSVLWPTTIPNVQEVQAYANSLTRFPFEPRVVLAEAVAAPFSSEAGRQVLESEFLIAGAKIKSQSTNSKENIRPLGFSSFGLGFGSTIITYRNCPNNCPLALWWGDSSATSGALNWYPLLPRETYSSARNIFRRVWD